MSSFNPLVLLAGQSQNTLRRLYFLRTQKPPLPKWFRHYGLNIGLVNVSVFFLHLLPNDHILSTYFSFLLLLPEITFDEEGYKICGFQQN